nr:cytidyltransferase, putative [uncultured archaeon]CBH36660.1 conserved hypothetical protein, cytidylyltransferase family [uncultured archaeon]
MNLKILAIIPARGGSKGIPRKNIRLLVGKPLIAYSIETALKANYIDKVVVSTEDAEIAEIAKIYGAEVIERPLKLAKDDVTLDIVVHHAVNSLEKKEHTKYAFVVTIQPTSPLLSEKTLDKAIEEISRNDYDTIISVTDETHLYWTIKKGKAIPLYEERKNRQYSAPIYRETGGFLVSKREIITEKSRIGNKIFLFETPRRESIDIDSFQDWWIAENSLKLLNIVFRVDGDYDVGLGHVYRAMTLANKMAFNHNVLFLMDKNKRLGIEKVKEYNYPIVTFENDEKCFKKLEELSPNIVINDILDTKKEYVERLKNNGYFVVNFEDLGRGSEVADIVINALYENSYPPKNHYYGYRYVCLREDFYIFPLKKVKKEVKQILITFGGTDPNNLTLRAIKAVEILGSKTIDVKIILGLGYNEKERLYGYINELITKGFKIEVKENVKMMAKEIYEADIVITSNGRTIYEVASIGAPCISIAQNDREARHLFVHTSRCVKYLGLAYLVSEDDIASSLEALMENYKLREEMNRLCFKYDIKRGISRVLRLVFDKYYEWKENE